MGLGPPSLYDYFQAEELSNLTGAYVVVFTARSATVFTFSDLHSEYGASDQKALKVAVLAFSYLATFKIRIRLLFRGSPEL
jgi:hypothetical protein